ncbi:FAD-dependent oxidoreductase [Parvularcula marina]|uniref:D-amino-acid oxidase n=1 Tax=Parvularcula marina TaxID=2292771 RepID=A0A371R841_9PROT|nr:FAD-dependent oxidoreductase [Parvularcula marina]RFB01600.1 FAD-binding oxidoreductase [Parvularcula marina]
MKQADGLSFASPYPALKVDQEREILTRTALRPYRAAGYVIRKDRFGEKTLIHNYGHGGCGVTLSWGCAKEAADLLKDVKGEDIAIIGGGVIGLTTARVLQQRGAKITVYAEEYSPDTTSDVAGALWFPVTLYDEDVATTDFLSRFRKAARHAYEVFTSLRDDPRYGVYPMRFFELADETKTEGWPDRVEGNDLYPGFTRVSEEEAFGFPDALRYEALMIDPSVFLPALMEDIRQDGGEFVTRKFASRDELSGLPEPVLVNCTGYGARALFGDEELVPVRGQLTLLEGQPAIDYGYALGRGDSEYLYMFPRRKSIVLGGSKQVGNDSLAIDGSARSRMLEGHSEIAERIVRQPKE